MSELNSPDSTAINGDHSISGAQPVDTKESPVQPLDLGSDTASSPQENATDPEREKEMRLDEINLISFNLLKQRGREVEQKEKTGEALTDAEKQILQLRKLSGYMQGDEAYTNDPIEFTKGTPLIITHEGRRVQIASVERQADGTLRCMEVIDDQGSKAEIKGITSKQIISGQIIAEATKISSGLSAPEQQILALEIASIQKGAAALEGLDQTAINRVITEAAGTVGIITAEDVRALIDKEKESRPELVKFGAMLQDKNIISQEMFSHLVNELGEIDTAMKESGWSEKVIQNYFDKMLGGTLDRKQATAAVQAFRSADIEGLVQQVIQEGQNASDAEKAENAKKRQDILQMSKQTGIGVGLGLLLVMAYATQTALKTVN